MDLLEAALRQSILWSVQRLAAKQNERDEPNAAYVEQNHETRTRAMITQFKIELNKLIGLKWLNGQQTSLGASEDEDDSDADDDDDNDDEEEEDEDEEHVLPPTPYGRHRHCRRLAAGSRSPKPTIRFKGKYSGVYNISGQTDEDDEDDESWKPSSQKEQRRKKATKQVCRLKEPDSSQETNAEDCPDEGYRSLSRGSASTKASLVQQLNDIKSRIVDLVQEINQNLSKLLNQEDLEACRRRCDALVAKIDLLIGGQEECQASLATTSIATTISSSSANSSTSNLSSTSSAASSPQTLSSDSMQRKLSKLSRKTCVITSTLDAERSNSVYEEQVQTIDYGPHNDKKDKRTRKPNGKLPEQTNHALVNDSQKTRVDLSTSSVCFNPREEPIDFGAMMRNFESKYQTEAQKLSTDNNCPLDNQNFKQFAHRQPVQHVQSSSSTSTQSSNSNKSSVFC